MGDFAANGHRRGQVMPGVARILFPATFVLIGGGRHAEANMTTEHNHGLVDESTRKVALGKRLEDFGWAVLLIAIGTIWLVPDKLIPQGSWLVAVGVILLGLNAIRSFNGIRMRGFSLAVGIVALFIGLGGFFGLKLPLFPIALIVIGVGMLLKPMFEKESVSAFHRGWCCCGGGEHEINQDAAQTRAAGH
jgi:hypothetical protein